jgi:hypothetical protein
MMDDQFLDDNECAKRLVTDYYKHGSLVVGFDFDGTVHDYHKRGDSFTKLIQLLRDLKGIGCKLICWTAYPDLTYVKNYLEEHKIPFDFINEESIKLGWESKKPFFSILLDDRAGLKSAYNQLTEVLNIINLEKQI